MTEDLNYKSYYLEVSHINGSKIYEKRLLVLRRTKVVLGIAGLIGLVCFLVPAFVLSNRALFDENFIDKGLPNFLSTGFSLMFAFAVLYPLQVKRERDTEKELQDYWQYLERAEKESLQLKNQRAYEAEVESLKEPDQWLLTRVRPAPQPYGVSDQGAEHLVAEWLKFLGFEEAEVTQYSGDGGIDVVTDEHVVQVKNYRDKAVSVTEVRELFGVAASERKRAVLFTATTCTSQAIEFADKNGIALIRFDARLGSLEEINDEGSDFLVNGDYE